MLNMLGIVRLCFAVAILGTARGITLTCSSQDGNECLAAAAKALFGQSCDSIDPSMGMLSMSGETSSTSSMACDASIGWEMSCTTQDMKAACSNSGAAGTVDPECADCFKQNAVEATNADKNFFDSFSFVNNDTIGEYCSAIYAKFEGTLTASSWLTSTFFASCSQCTSQAYMFNYWCGEHLIRSQTCSRCVTQDCKVAPPPGGVPATVIGAGDKVSASLLDQNAAQTTSSCKTCLAGPGEKYAVLTYCNKKAFDEAQPSPIPTPAPTPTPANALTPTPTPTPSNASEPTPAPTPTQAPSKASIDVATQNAWGLPAGAVALAITML